MKLYRNQPIVITIGGAKLPGRVLEVADPVNLPELPEAPPQGSVREMLDHLHIDQIAWLEYLKDGCPVSFAALHNDKRGWIDLQRQHVHITPLTMGATS